MATTNDGIFNLPFPESTDPVNVHTDIKALADRLKIVLPPLGLSAFQITVINDSGETLPVGCPVYVTGETNGTVKVNKSLPTTTSPVLGLLKQPLTSGSQGVAIVAGILEGVNTTNFTPAGSILYVGPSGSLVSGTGTAAVGVALTIGEDGVVMVEAKGNGTWGALKAGLS